MLTISLPTVQGDTLTFDVPQNPSEVKLRQKIDYDIAHEQFIIWYADHLKKGTLLQQKNRYIAKSLVPLSAFFDVDLGKMLALDISTLLDENGEVITRRFTNHIKRLQTQGILIDVNSLETTVLELFALVEQACRYQGVERTKEDHTFTYKDTDSDEEITWTIPYWIAAKLSGSKKPTPVSVMQAVEILDLKRKYQPTKKNPDINGSKRYSEFLYTLAMLARKEDEDDGFIYDSDTELEVFLDERAAHFKDIDMKTAFDVIFFLIDITVVSWTTLQIVSFLTISLPQLAPKSS